MGGGGLEMQRSRKPKSLVFVERKERVEEPQGN